MIEQHNKINTKKVDTKEFELPETLFVTDIDNKVFQGIVLECLSKIEGISLIEGNFIDNIFGRGVLEGLKGITTEQDSRQHSVNVKVEVNIQYGLSIPQKAEEIQTKISEEITKMTGLHVANVHVLFKSIISTDATNKTLNEPFAGKENTENMASEEYNDEF